MKKYSMKLLACALLMFSASSVYASIIETVQLDFASGAQYNGTITFNDNYHGMIATSGTLTGGSYNYNQSFDWTWWTGTGNVNPQDNNGDGYLNDWLMNNAGGSWTDFIGISWDQGASIANNAATFVFGSDSYYGGVNSTGDLMVGASVATGSLGTASTNTASVPEPASLALFGLGLIGLGIARKRVNS